MIARTRIADYAFVELIGSGGHGSVHLATRPDRLPVSAPQVAVKVLSGNTSPAAFDRAADELRLWASMRSPHLAQVYDTGREDGTFYYAMTYYPLGSLGRSSEALTRNEVHRAVAHAARAAHDLHEVGSVHRDIKPNNVLLHEAGAHLSDLGLAQILTPGQTVTGLGAIGAVEFLDPLIVKGGPAGRPSDIFALAATWHRALTGIGIYPDMVDDNPILALRSVIETDPVVDARLPDAEAAIIEACLHPDPSSRPATAADLAAQIEELITS